jgi:hypothetical protein
MGVNLGGLIDQSEQYSFYAFNNTGTALLQGELERKMLTRGKQFIHPKLSAKNKFDISFIFY